jgi:hypothetical protein
MEFRAEGMGQGQGKVVGLPEAIQGKASRRSKELVVPLQLHGLNQRLLPARAAGPLKNSNPAELFDEEVMSNDRRRADAL